MPYEDWCDACKGVGYNDGCKQCDEEYDKTMFCWIENELTCAIAYPERRLEYLISALNLVHEHALWGNYNKELLEERIGHALENQKEIVLNREYIPYNLNIKLEN